MALKLDEDLLNNLGLASLSSNDKQAMLGQIRETLEMRVGTRLAEQMTDQQLDEFQRFVDSQDDAGALQWLEANFPNYKLVVNEEFDKLQIEVKQAAPQIVASASSAQVDGNSSANGSGNNVATGGGSSYSVSDQQPNLSSVPTQPPSPL